MDTNTDPSGPATPGPPEPSEPRWLRCYASEIQPGDLVEIAGEHYRVTDRTSPVAYRHTFKITLPDGHEMTLLSSTKIRIFDPDGSVSQRVTELPPEHPEPVPTRRWVSRASGPDYRAPEPPGVPW